MNKSHLNHLTVLARIYAAMRKAVKLGYSQYVPNRKGESFIRVSYKRNSVSAFTFYDKKGNNVTSLVLSVLQSSN